MFHLKKKKSRSWKQDSGCNTSCMIYDQDHIEELQSDGIDRPDVYINVPV